MWQELTHQLELRRLRREKTKELNTIVCSMIAAHKNNNDEEPNFLACELYDTIASFEFKTRAAQTQFYYRKAARYLLPTPSVERSRNYWEQQDGVWALTLEALAPLREAVHKHEEERRQKTLSRLAIGGKFTGLLGAVLSGYLLLSRR